jgi:hypothetical protein
MLYDAVPRFSGLTSRSQKIPGPWFRASDQYDPRLHHSCLQIRYPFKKSRRDAAGRCNATFRFSNEWNVREVRTCSSRRTRKPNVVRAAKVRHQSCGKLDALSISRNCIDCFERPTCQMHGSNQMRFLSGHDRCHLMDTARLLVDILAYHGSVALRWERHDARVFVCGMIVCTSSTDQGHGCGAT